MATGLEILGAIDACIGIVTAVIEIGKAAKDAKGQPAKLREVFEQLPAVSDLLLIARQNDLDGKIPQPSKNAVNSTLGKLEDDLIDLKAMFERICPEDKANRGSRLFNAGKNKLLGRNSNIDNLFVSIQENLKLLEQKAIFVIDGKLDGLQEAVEALKGGDEDASKTNISAGRDAHISQGDSKMAVGKNAKQYNAQRDINFGNEKHGSSRDSSSDEDL